MTLSEWGLITLTLLCSGFQMGV
ncbi:MAG: IPTL-CTERM sorting domain-containing protein [Pseudohongiellaceae bacterium]